MKQHLFKIFITALLFYVLLRIFSLFIEFAMDKDIITIKDKYTHIDITMPCGSYFYPYLKIYKMNTFIDGNITILYKNNIIYSQKIQESYIDNSNHLYNIYPLVSSSTNINDLLKRNDTYTFKIQLKNKIETKKIILKLSWLKKYIDCIL